jgi:hypothetical protein
MARALCGRQYNYRYGLCGLPLFAPLFVPRHNSGNGQFRGGRGGSGFCWLQRLILVVNEERKIRREIATTQQGAGEAGGGVVAVCVLDTDTWQCLGVLQDRRVEACG